MTPDDRDDRPKLSWREIDRRREKSSVGADDRPRAPAVEARSRVAAREYLRSLDGMFSSGHGGAEGERLAQAVRDAHGSPELAAACREFVDRLGYPDDEALLSIFLDATEPELVGGALAALRRLQEAGRLEARPGLRRQLRMLAEDSDDAVAEGAEDLLELI